MMFTVKRMPKESMERRCPFPPAVKIESLSTERKKAATRSKINLPRKGGRFVRCGKPLCPAVGQTSNVGCCPAKTSRPPDRPKYQDKNFKTCSQYQRVAEKRDRDRLSLELSSKMSFGSKKTGRKATRRVGIRSGVEGFGYTAVAFSPEQTPETQQASRVNSSSLYHFT